MERQWDLSSIDNAGLLRMLQGASKLEELFI
jgi:hypothetical protein